MKVASFLLLALWLVVGLSCAFVPHRGTFQAARLVQGSTSYKQRVVFMSSEETEESTEVATTEAPAQPQGTFYDDEVEPAEKVGISDSMRERLKREASTGLDPDAKQTNVLLYIILGVGALVALGGAGIFY